MVFGEIMRFVGVWDEKERPHELENLSSSYVLNDGSPSVLTMGKYPLQVCSATVTIPQNGI